MSNANIQTNPNKLTKVPAQISIWDGKQWLEISNQQTINTINENVGTAQKTADGKNSITWGTGQPSTAINGDIWLKKDANGNYSIQVYNGTDWDSPAEANIEAVKAQVSSLPHNYYQTDQPSGTDFTNGSHWYQQTGTDSNGNPIYTIYLWNSSTKAWNKMLNSGEADNASQINQVKSDLSQATSDITQAQSNITTVSNNLSSAKSDLQSQVDSAKSDITQAQSNITTVSNNLSSAKSDLQSQVDSAKSDITQAQSDIKTNANAISDNKGNIASLTSTASKLSSDMTDAQGNISTLQQDATGFKADIADNKGNISSLQTTVNGLNSTVSSLSSDNTTNKQNISTLQNTANGFTNTVATLQTQVNNSAVGTNLFVGTKDFDNLSSWADYDGWTILTDTYNGLSIAQTDQDWGGLSQYIQVSSGEIYTFSVYTRYISGTGTSTMYMMLNTSPENGHTAANTTPNNTDVSLTSNWQRVSFTFTITSDGWIKPRIERTNNNTNTLQICGMKLEKGSVATDWSANPADNATVTSVSTLTNTVNGLSSTVADNKGNISTLQNTVSGLSNTVSDNKGNISSLTNTVNGLSSTVSDNKGDISSLKNTTGGLSSTVATKANQSDLNTTNSNVSSLTNTVNGLNSTVSSLSSDNTTNKQNISTLQNTANGFTNTVAALQTQVDNSAVGTNLLLGTGDYSAWTISSYAKVVTSNSINYLHTKNTETTYTDSTKEIGIQPKGPYVSSYNSAGSGSIIYVVQDPNLTNSGTSINWNNHYDVYSQNFSDPDFTEHSFPVTINYTTAFVLVIIRSTQSQENWVAHMKLEKGSVATDYSANPADNATVTSVSTLTNTVNGLSSTVSNNSGDISTLKNTTSGLSNTVADNKGNISTLQTRANSFDVSVGHLQTSVNSLGQVNLVPNGGFIQGIEGWSTWGSPNMYYSDQTPDTLNGHHSIVLRVSGQTSQTWYGAASSRFAVKDNNTISYQAWIHVWELPDSNQTFSLQIEWFNDGVNGTNGRTDYTSPSATTIYSTGSWVHVKAEGLQPPSGTTAARLILYVSMNGSASMTQVMATPGSTIGAYVENVSDMLTQSGNYAGLTINSNGLTQVAGSTSVYLSNKNGFEIQKSGLDIFHVDTSGNLTMQGDITAGNISGVNFTGDSLTLKGTLGVTGSISADNGNVVISSDGITIQGAGLTIGDSSGKTTTYIKPDGTFVTDEGVFSGSATITGGSLKVGSNFSVDTSGNLIANNAAITGTLYVNTSGNETWIDGNGIHNSDNSTNDVYVKNGKITSTWTDGTGTTGNFSAATGEIVLQYGNVEIGMLNSRTNSPEIYFSDASQNTASINFANNSLGLGNDGDITLSTPNGSDVFLQNGGGGVICNSLANFTRSIIVGNNKSGDQIWVKGDGNFDGKVTCKSLSQTSLLSKKTNISKIDGAIALDKINQTNIYDYQFRDDVANGSAKHYASYIIDDVNDVSQYTEPSEFLSEDKKGRDDGTQLAYLTAAVQYLAQKVKNLESK